MGAEPYNRGRLLRRAKAFTYIFLLICIFLTLLSLDNGILTLGPATKMYVQSAASPRTHNAPAAKQNTPKPSPAAAPPALDPASVLIMVKTGATALWQRLPIHLSTTLSDGTRTPNIAIYSDAATAIAGRPIVDVLANASSALRASPDFRTWHAVRAAARDNRYLDQQGDEALYVPGAWRLDKYKFVPMVAHAARNFPGKQWYVFMEDDTFYFWDSLYAWLATFDADEPVFGGSVRYKDVFTDLVEPKLTAVEDEWDNLAEEKHYSSQTVV
ncbi:putative glycosyltransferase family 31 protein [Neofusicoccum parvum UCRNP2]|uniref:Putative glycosyltransferase family 31 protein n=1 Tax=Botryosphaeria parva (strain UCR-NP2) TaxID=1287680 RepID=R1G5L5_BOTPV|nr:putative glycosyltransferase family 31 protein [Neofusicoccum parvum UCRNP2]